MLPNDFSSLYDWSPAAKLPYGDYLRSRPLESAARFAIDNHNKELIATNQQLSERSIEVLSVNPERSFTMLSLDVGQDAETGQEAGALNPASGKSASITGRFNWGFSEALISQGQMNISLDELLKLTKTPSQIWACEQFELGRDEFRRQLYKEALQSATRAIEGLGSNQGNQTEFRFYFLVGIIRLGSYRNNSPELIKPQLAQQAFLAAARYAESRYPAEAGQALICAGRAAFVAGDIENAIVHTRKGLNLVPTHAAGMYLLGRALFLKGTRNDAADRLVDAMLLNAEQALYACGDPDFGAKADFLNGVLRQAFEGHEARYRQLAERYRRALQTLRDFSFMDVPAEALQLPGLVEIQEIPKAAEALAAAKTMLGYSAAIQHYLGGYPLLPAWFEQFKMHCIRQLRGLILEPPRREDYLPAGSSEESQGGAGPSKAGLAGGLVSGIAVFLFESSQIAMPIYRGILESIAELFLVPLLTGAGITAVITLAQDMRREYVRAKHRSALAAFEAACYTYKNSKASLEAEIAEIQSMPLPKEFAAPSLANAAKPGALSDATAAQKRVSAWAKL